MTGRPSPQSAGPEGRETGRVWVAPALDTEDDAGPFNASWERAGAQAESREFAGWEQAVAWARARAPVVLIRWTAGDYWSAGRVAPPGLDVPRLAADVIERADGVEPGASWKRPPATEIYPSGEDVLDEDWAPELATECYFVVRESPTLVSDHEVRILEVNADPARGTEILYAFEPGVPEDTWPPLLLFAAARDLAGVRTRDGLPESFGWTAQHGTMHVELAPQDISVIRIGVHPNRLWQEPTIGLDFQRVATPGSRPVGARPAHHRRR